MSPKTPSGSGAPTPIVPIPVPPAHRILLFGGTFDPVHLGHTQAAAAARDLSLGPDAWLIFVPAARSPLKDHTPGASDSDRLGMLESALRCVPRSAIWTDELARPAPSFWIDTLRRARTVLSDSADVRFLIGADAAISFQRWRDWRAVLDLARPVVMARPPLRTGADFASQLTQAGWTRADIDNWLHSFVEGAVIDISATQVRQALATGDPRAARWLDPAVLDLIRRRGLYPPPPAAAAGAAPSPPRPS